MPEPDEVRSACIGCGALNPAGAEVCSGCGHHFAPLPVAPPPPPPAPPTTDFPVPPTAPVPPPVARAWTPVNPYEPPKSEPPRAPTFRILTAMRFIAVVGLCLGAFAADTTLGVGVSLGLIPATIRTILVSGWREYEGRPMRPDEQALTFFLTAMSAYLVVVSSVIAFGLTCFPIGLGTGDITVAVGAGSVVGLGVGVWLTYALLRVARRRADRGRDRDDIRWR